MEKRPIVYLVNQHAKRIQRKVIVNIPKISYAPEVLYTLAFWIRPL